MARLMEVNQQGQREALANLLSNIQAKACPYTSFLPKIGKPNRKILDYLVETYPEVAHEGVVDGKDADTFNHISRKKLQAVAQKVWWNPSVSDFAEETVVAGLPGRGEMAHQHATALVLVKRKMEQRALSAADSQEGDGATVKDETRGCFSWASDTAQADHPVPTEYLTPTASRHTTALDTVTEDTINTQFESSADQRKAPGYFVGVVGAALKRTFSDYSEYSDASGTKLAVRQFTQEAASKKLIKIVDRVEMDTFVADLVLSWFLYTNETTGATTNFSSRSGFFFDPDMMCLAYTRLPNIRRLEDKGGGPRSICDAIFMHICKNPLGLVSFEISADS